MRVKKRNVFRNRMLFIFLSLFLISIVSVMSYNKYKAFEVKVKQERLLAAQKQAEELKIKAEQEEKKKQEEQKQRELKNKEDNLKIQQAVSGKGSSKLIPVLMYHSIDYEKNNELRIPKDKFREQMQYLKDNGFHPITLDELYSNIVFNTTLQDKPIVLTFDDGYSDNYTNAYPVLKEFGFKATVFVITGCIGTGPFLNADQLKEMDKNGVEIQSHTVTHKKPLSEMTAAEQKTELQDSKAALESLLGKKVDYFAYPWGKYNTDTLKLIQESGYKMAFTTAEGKADKSNGIYKLKRIYISNNYSMDYYKKLVNQ